MPEGNVRGLSQFYVDGLERMEIWINKNNAHPIPYHDNLRTPTTLHIGDRFFEAGVRTTPNVNVVWICPNLQDNQGHKVSLARVLTDNGFQKNQRVIINVENNIVHVLPFPQR
ncbi:MAG: hypothetical protein Q8N09_04890 [Thermodesulfovibrionia bacterium]|nr:hypothetical protein [Thermodesulfovibrionia bacterium]